MLLSSARPRRQARAAEAAARGKWRAKAAGKYLGARLFSSYHELAKVWTHPQVLPMALAPAGQLREEREELAYESMDDFVVRGSGSDGSDGGETGYRRDEPSWARSGAGASRRRAKLEKKRLQAEAVRAKVASERPSKWWARSLDEEGVDDDELLPGMSAKLLLVLDLLEEAQREHSKVLLFSQSLVVLELIERVLHRQAGQRARGGKRGKAGWRLGVDYFMLVGDTVVRDLPCDIRREGGQSLVIGGSSLVILEGKACNPLQSLSSQGKTRQGWIDRFNDPLNHQSRLFLISTKAGGLGVNLTAASRVVIFDASWNPSHDTQAIYRAYRFGQQQRVRIYRLLAHATMEEKIYSRQVEKNALASRVVDGNAEERHFSADFTASLFRYDPLPRASDAPAQEKGGQAQGAGEEEGAAAASSIRFATEAPSDALLARLLERHAEHMAGYVPHDSLLGGDAALSKIEQDEAWTEYQQLQAAEQLAAQPHPPGCLVQPAAQPRPPGRLVSFAAGERVQICGPSRAQSASRSLRRVLLTPTDQCRVTLSLR